MKGIIISGHGQFAQGLGSMIEGIIGQPRQLAIVPFSFDSSAAELSSALKSAASAVDQGDGVIFLTDIPGGTPFNQSSEIAINNPLYEVLTGANFTMVSAAILLREEISEASVLTDEILLAGKEAITSLAIKLNANNGATADGI